MKMSIQKLDTKNKSQLKEYKMNHGIGKLTMQELGIKSEETKAAVEAGESFIARFDGAVLSLKSDESKYGNYIDFKGTFDGMNAETGEVFTANRLILPSLAEEWLFSRFESRKDDKGLNFSIEIHAHASDKATCGYKYSIVDLLDDPESSPLSELKKLVPPMISRERKASKDSKASKTLEVPESIEAAEA